MIAVIQRCLEASVRVEDRVVGRIDLGFLVLLGVEVGDGPMDLEWMVAKIAGLRLFADEQGKMNLDLRGSGGAVLCVSQFTLLADCSKGRRPGFARAESPELAQDMWEEFCRRLEALEIPVERGSFGADMKVALVNDGPVTILLDSRRSK